MNCKSNAIYYLPTFHGVLLDVQGVELASTIDHVTVTEMDAVTWFTGLDLLQVKTGTQCVRTKKLVKL